jgi:hypothetical protein
VAQKSPSTRENTKASSRNFKIAWGTGFCYTFPRALAKEGKEMAEEAKQEKKKVYVETTVVSDAGGVKFVSLPPRFIMLLNRDTFDYTEWRKNNLFQGETVDSLCDQIEQFQESQAVPDREPTMA